MTSNQPTNMYGFIVELLPCGGQAQVRSAGSKGSSLFRECIDRGVVPLYAIADSDKTDFAPIKNIGEDRVDLGGAAIDVVASSKGMRAALNYTTHTKFKPIYNGSVNQLVIRDGDLDFCEKMAQIAKPKVGISIQNVEGQKKKDSTNFLKDQATITQVDLEATGAEGSSGGGLGVVTELNFFLSGCSSLKSARLLQGLLCVTVIKSDFMKGCSSLEEISLAPFTTVIEVGKEFLFECTNLKAIDLKPLHNVTKIGMNFLSRCKALEDLDVSPLSKITEIPDNFVNECIELKEINCQELTNVKKIGKSFLAGAHSITTINVEPFRGVTEVEGNFLSRCSRLTNISLEPLRSVTKIGTAFLGSSTSLASIDLAPLTNVKTVGSNFLISSVALEAIDLAPLSNVTTVGDSFLSGCTGLKTIDVKPLSKAKKGPHFLEGFKGEKTGDGCTMC